MIQFTPQFEGQTIRITGTSDAPWFGAKDACAALGLQNVTQAVERLDEDDVCQTYFTDSLGRQQLMLAISEAGLYMLILRSDKPQAKPFKKWVTQVVLPAIRKTGSYHVSGFHTPRTLSEALQLAADQAKTLEYQAEQIEHTRALIEEATFVLEAQAGQLEAKEFALEAQAPKVEFYDAVTESATVCQLAVACQVAGLPFGRNTLCQKLRELNVLSSTGQRYNLPLQKYVTDGLFTIKENKYENPKTGELMVSFTTYVTQKGIDWLIRKFVKEEDVI